MSDGVDVGAEGYEAALEGVEAVRAVLRDEHSLLTQYKMIIWGRVFTPIQARIPTHLPSSLAAAQRDKPCGCPEGEPVRTPHAPQLMPWGSLPRVYLIPQHLPYTLERTYMPVLAAPGGLRLGGRQIVEAVGLLRRRPLQRCRRTPGPPTCPPSSTASPTRWASPPARSCCWGTRNMARVLGVARCTRPTAACAQRPARRCDGGEGYRPSWSGRALLQARHCAFAASCLHNISCLPPRVREAAASHGRRLSARWAAAAPRALYRCLPLLHFRALSQATGLPN